MMKKKITNNNNIILSDRGATFVDTIIEHTDWVIRLLIIDDFGHHKEKYENNKRIEEIITLNELMSGSENYNINFNEMKQALGLFHIGDVGSRRIKDDIYFSHYQFYLSYSYWKTFLDENEIDFCIITNTLHGFSSDYMLEEVAYEEGIKTYNIFYHFFDKYAIYVKNRDKLLKRSIKTDLTDLEKVSSYSTTYNWDRGIEKIPYGRYLKYVYKLLGAYGVRMASFLVRGTYPIHYRDSSLSSYHRCWKHIKKMNRYVKKLYDEPNLDSNYIIYFLHFEPEAAVTGNTEIVDSQLFYIELLAKSLPHGYVLYVKEHPDLYKLNKWGMEYFIPEMDTFYSRYFYEKLTHIPNVKLIDYKLSARDLITRAKAVSSICGTVLSEAILQNKPIIMFAGNKHLYTYYEDIFSPQSTNELRKIIDEIEKGYIPSYAGINELLDEYLFDRSKKGELEAINTIAMDILETP